MEVLLLGEVAIVGENGRVAIEAPLARRCIAALALSTGGVTLDRLADMVWGETPPTNWKPALRNIVAKLRQRLDSIGAGGDVVIETTASGYRLAATCTVDVHDAVRLSDAADESLTHGDPDAAVAQAIEALDRLARPLLPDLDAEWITGYRTRVEWADNRALQVAAAACRTLGRFGQAIDLARRAIEDNPLGEESHRQLIAALAASGDRSAALRAYEDCRRTLATELGISPDRETVELHLTVIGTEPERPAQHRVEGPLLGRQEELVTLRGEVAPGSVVTLVGPGGIGKSRLAGAFAADARDDFDGGRWWVACDSMRDASQMVTGLSTTLGTATDGDAFENVMRELAGRGPTLVVLDGVDHIADEAANVVTSLNRRCPNVATLVTNRVPLGLDVETVVRPTHLDPESAGTACFVAYASAAGVTLPDDDVARSAIATICHAVGGIPLGIELAARQTAEVSLADLADRVSERLDGQGVAADLIDGVVESTIALLDDAELAVFRRLSLIGGPADLAVLEATMADDDLRRGRIVRILAQLVERALVRVDRGAVRWTYDQHPLLRAAGRQGLTSTEVRQLNERLASALFARLPPTATATPNVADIHAVLPAIRGLFSAALDGEADVDTALRLAYWLHRFWVAAALDEGRGWLERLLDASPRDAPSRGPAEFGLGFVLLWSGQPDAATDHLVAATELVDPTDRLLAAAHYYIANAAENRRPDLARRHYSAAIAAASAAGLDDVAVRCRLGLANVEFEAGERTAGLQRCEDALQVLEPTVDADAYVVVLCPYVTMLISAGRLDDADRTLQRIERSVGEDVRITTMLAAAARARLEWHRGRPDVARRHAERAQAMIEQAGVGRLDGLVSPIVALAALASDEPDAAVGELARGLKAAIAAEQFAIVADILDAATIVAAALGRVDRAAEVHAAAEQLRMRSQVGRGALEQAELDATINGVELDAIGGEPDVELARIVDLIGGLTGD